MLKFIDDFLNRTTMYRLLVYYLGGLLVLAAMFGVWGWMPYSPWWIFFSTVVIGTLCWAVNTIFAYVFEAPSNDESTIITALILVLIISPLKNVYDAGAMPLIIWAPILAITSKYIVAIGKKHFFNPAALAVVLTALFLNQSASWWISSAVMAPFIIIGGLMVVKKIRRWDLVGSFILVVLAGIIGSHLSNPSVIIAAVERTVSTSSLLFLAFVMLTEPYTTPPTAMLRICYGALVGFLFVPDFHLGNFYFTPELALIVGNIFTYAVSPKTKLILELKEKVQLTRDIYDFVFTANQKLAYQPGQYLEWTLPHEQSDNRGIRRYFTISSAPTEPEIKMGVKFYEPSSTYKKKLLIMQHGDTMVASQLSGDFVLPTNKNKKLVFITGGIGVTPFRSMIKYLVDKGESRSIVIFYSNKTMADFAYTQDFDRAEAELGIKTVYTITDQATTPVGWTGEVGSISREMIEKYVPDYINCAFYISGPHIMVNSFQKILEEMGIKNDQVKKDYFPGFA